MNTLTIETLHHVFDDRLQYPQNAVMLDNLATVAGNIDDYVIDNPGVEHVRFTPEGIVPGSVTEKLIGSIRVDRDIACLASYHHLTATQLLEFSIGGSVVDVGAGRSTFLDTFVDDANTIAVDKYKVHMLHQRAKGHMALLGCGSSMPSIDSGSVRLLHASFSLPFWSPNQPHAAQVADEYVRVLEPGGIALVGSIFDRNEHYDQEEALIYREHPEYVAPASVIRAAFYKRLLERSDIALVGSRYISDTMHPDINAQLTDVHLPNFLMIQRIAVIAAIESDGSQALDRA